MVDPRLIDYIKTSLSRKIPIEETKKALFAQGWRDSDVKEAISIATQKTTQKSFSQPLQRPQLRPASQKPPLQFPKQPIQRTQPIRRFTPNQFQPVQQKPQEEKKFTLSKNLIFISIGVFVLLALVGGIIFLVLRNSGSISDEELSQGVSINLKPDKQVKFNIDSIEHTLEINSISENSVSITILSDPITSTLDIGDTQKFDFEHDGTYDLSVTLNEIVDGEADISLKQISEACDEDWDCTDWSDCEDEEQTRECTDLADCGSESDKPDEVQECELVLNCAQLSGLICNETEICDGDITNASNGDCCLGDCVSIGLIDCSDLDCFIYQAENCTPSNLTYSSELENGTWDQNDVYYFEIKGLKNEKCNVYNKLINSYGSFTTEGTTNLESEGKNETEIDQIAAAINNSLSSSIGNTGTCNYSIAGLVGVLGTTDTNGYFELSSSEITQYECTGTLFI